MLRIGSACAVGAALPQLGAAQVTLVDSREEFERLIPTDKGLAPEWIDSLTRRTKPEVLRGWGDELKFVGMPIGGIGCGQLYLGGDGRLWLWDIFKSNYRREPDHGQRIAAMTLCGHYINPVALGEQYNKHNGAAVQQGFAIRIRQDDETTVRTLDHSGFPGVTFRGEYPVARVNYADEASPVSVTLEAFSPFIPLNVRDSALPATVMSYTLTNTSDSPVDVDLAGWLQNTTCPYVDDNSLGARRNRVVEVDGRLTLLCTVESPQVTAPGDAGREDVVFADFEGADWGDWRVEGKAFAGGPFPLADREYQERAGHEGEGSVNSHNHREHKSVIGRDNLTGTLTSPPFKVERKFITLSVGGGNRPDDCFVEVRLKSGESFAKVTGHKSNKLRKVSIDVSRIEGQEAEIRIVDNGRGPWGNIQADQIVFTDKPVQTSGIEDRHGYGSMALSLLQVSEGVRAGGSASIKDVEELLDGATVGEQAQPMGETLVGGLSASVSLEPGQSETLDFAITWYFPEHNEQDVAPGFFLRTRDIATLGRHYRPWFRSAADVAGYLASNQERLLGETRLWNETWYDSTLPHWLLDRTFVTLDCVATQMFHWFDNGRPYGWEGVDCCPGTCTHVWQYAQGLSRIFPELERAFREEVDFKAGVGFHPQSGLISDRGDFHKHEATDGQAGTVLRAYREHQMSADGAFLSRIWPNVKKAIQFLIAKDPDGNGLIEGRQPHTLDAAWYGPMAWISGMYQAALAAGAEMADQMNDPAFAKQCRTLNERGYKKLVEVLFDGEYFIHIPGDKVAIQSGKGCHIDQVLGEAWARQVALPRVFPRDETVSALNSLWRYNFAPDAGGYAIKHREIEQTFRWYAMEGEAGLLMCTWPKGGATDAIPGQRLRAKENPDVWTGPGGYFNECMNGFEYQAAAHMIYEGEPGSSLVEQGLAITRAVHDRYAAAKRNPYNEIECSDHYARSMASFGVFLASCGYEYDGPARHLGLAPRVSPDKFRAAFTAAEGWGTFEQRRDDQGQHVRVSVRWGKLTLGSLSVALSKGSKAKQVACTLGGRPIDSDFVQDDQRVTISFSSPVEASSDKTLSVSVL